MAELPSVVFFMVDQLAAKWLEVGQSGVFPTPNLDRLRREGVSFTHCFSSNPVCCPARATIATGLSTRGHGVLENGYSLNPELPTFMRSLQQAGWRTGAFGKVHFWPHFSTFYPDYHHYGFDVTHITEDGRGGEWLDWIRAEHPDDLDAVLTTFWAGSIPELQAYGEQQEDLATRISELRRHWHWDMKDYPGSGPNAAVLPFREELSQTNWITGHALDFIQDTPREQPLFAHISYVQPHSPFMAPREYLDFVNAERIADPIRAEWQSDPNSPEELRRRRPRTSRAWRLHRQIYFADIIHLDRQLGRVLEALEKTGRLASTYFFFLSDHGEMLYDHGLLGKGEVHYDPCIRVPLTVRGPNIRRDITSDAFVQLEDIAPTVYELTHTAPEPMPVMGPYLRTPADQIPTMYGRSLVPMLQGATLADWRDAVYIESYNNIEQCTPEQWARTMRTYRFRYTLYPNAGEQLFDLRQDPSETHNLAKNPDYSAIRQEHRDRLLNAVIMQDYPHTRRELYALGVH